MNINFIRTVSRLVIASLLCLVLPVQQAYAGIVGTDRVSISPQSQSERQRIHSFLDREDVRKAMQAQGVDGNTANARVDALTDDEAHKVASNIDNMPAGGDILGLILTIFLVLLITDILGFTKVFSFTRSVQ